MGRSLECHVATTSTTSSSPSPVPGRVIFQGVFGAVPLWNVREGAEALGVVVGEADSAAEETPRDANSI